MATNGFSRRFGDKVDMCSLNLSKAIAEEQKKLEEWEKRLQDREDAWNKACKNLQVSELGEPVSFNVGGTKFSASLSTWLKIPDTYFSTLLSGRWDVKCSKDGSIFIDRNAVSFGYILDYLRDPENFYDICGELTPLERYHLAKDCQFYLLPQIQDILNTERTEFGLPLRAFSDLKAHIGFKTARLLYKWSEHEAGKTTFHKMCDDQGPTIVVAELLFGGFIGGYASVSWDSTSSTSSDPNAFLFTVQAGSLSAKLLKQTGQNSHFAVMRHYLYGVAFGGGYDLQIGMENPLTFHCATAHTFVPHGIPNGTRLRDVFVLGVQM